MMVVVVEAQVYMAKFFLVRVLATPMLWVTAFSVH